jgi:murein tripeptide amidase MpaA
MKNNKNNKNNNNNQQVLSTITVNTDFDAGSIEVVDITNPQNLQFKIRRDTNSHFAQWFYFALNNVSQTELTINLIELDKTAYPKGWENYNVFMSYDNHNWERLASTYSTASNSLTFKLSAIQDQVYFAYFEPYPYSRHAKLIQTVIDYNISDRQSQVSHQVLGKTQQNRNIDLLTIGNLDAKYKVWITARQHPGETMAEWFMEGLIKRLLNKESSTSQELLRTCVFYLVPNMNPDGSCLGNLRVNSVGTNLNRAWQSPSVEDSPEVFYVRNKMLMSGVDIFLDIHGDEAIPYLFTDGCDDNPSFSSKQDKLSKRFIQEMIFWCKEYQTAYGYEKGHFTSETATLATSWVGNHFDCLAFTIEMPFKDTANLPDKRFGWNGKRSYLLGEKVLSAICQTIPYFEEI